MKRLAHISDLHFGREEERLVAALHEALTVAAPDAIIVSGDLTQRARKPQFRQARAFLRTLPDVPQLVVPGNHDVSATNLVDRLARPLRRFRRYITDDLNPHLELDGIAIAGINTVRLLSAKDGRINRTQVATACQQLSRAEPDAVRIVVTHHPIDLPPGDRENAPISRAPMALKAFAHAGVDLFLSGHLHAPQSLLTRTPYAAVVVHAGTAVSTRTRGEPNGWNLIDFEDRTRITVRRQHWDSPSLRFVEASSQSFERRANGWAML